MRRLVVALALACGVVSSSSCTLLWIFNNDPAGLPCDFTSSQEGTCLEGYVCKQQSNNEFICVAKGALAADEACALSDECDEGLTCDTFYGLLCADGGDDDANCSLVDPPDVEKNLACHVICEIGNASTCPSDMLCVDGEPDFCARGVCATDSDCELVAGQGALCAGEGLNEGKSGLCFEACNPLACDAATGICNDCTGVDGAPDGKACVPVQDEALSSRNVCDFPGTLPAFADCSTGEGCVAGSFCGQFAVDVFLCTPWCNAAGGAPECPVNSVCTPVVGDLGVCQQ
jgi:hypothetical protein